MNKRERIETVFLYGVFICFILLLMKIFFLSRVSISELLHSQRTFIRSINLIPFHSIGEYLAGSSSNLRRFAFGNVIGNILVFVPLGVYISVFKNNTRVLINLLFICIASLVVEFIQGLLGIGTADVDDIILNGLGGWIGIVVYKSLLFVLRNEKRVQTTITVLSIIIGLPVIYYYLFMIKMRF
ncbi:glycopeptide antibiotics resistance protein [Paenibacillus cellulosilyticus]|uniref:Glycopeptide antibiotics resistance protein n=2 Tax=Paenibacillus cellulosilyticus TaxID=375489 RepID=A0A2V2YTJ0_9BACL|nr:VanZ family protein [Paenibacillus cellulosilyticus]PWW02793.1 glycopeptide antibiotics resistance protein [Paenibacillus cellulosilyticus]QKS45716.1 VanZ family protein [Paenibacillus cellulosilyticus]